MLPYPLLTQGIYNSLEQVILNSLFLRKIFIRAEARMFLLLNILHRAMSPAFSELLFQPVLMALFRRYIRVPQMELNPIDSGIPLPVRSIVPRKLRIIPNSFTISTVYLVSYLCDSFYE